MTQPAPQKKAQNLPIEDWKLQNAEEDRIAWRAQNLPIEDWKQQRRARDISGCAGLESSY